MTQTITETTEEPRIGVFVCHCGHKIAGTVDVVFVSVMDYFLPGFVFSSDEMLMFSVEGLVLF